MIIYNFKNFKISATPFLSEGYCECGDNLQEVSNGLLSGAFYCRKCESVYTLKLIKIQKKYLNKRFIEQCRKETNRAEYLKKERLKYENN